MADKSKIEWTDRTWNFLAGCSKISYGCKNCYAIKDAARMAGNPNEKIRAKYASTITSERGSPNWSGEITFSEHTLLEPLKWKKPQKVFVNSMSDLFHENVKDEWLDQAFAVMALTPHITYQILTKRPERMREYMNNGETRFNIHDELDGMCNWQDLAAYMYSGLISNGTEEGEAADADRQWLKLWPLPNVWLGVSVEDQKTADERIPLLLQTPAAVRWISAEPLLGPIDLSNRPLCEGAWWNALTGRDRLTDGREIVHKGIPVQHNRLDWIVLGGESGPNARPFDIQWAGNIIAQCKAADVPVFVKQLGGNLSDEDLSECQRATGKSVHNKKGGDPSEWPEDLRVREFPTI